MNTNLSAAFRRLSRHIPFTALLATAAFRAEAPLFFRSFLVHRRSALAVIHRRAFLILSLCADWAPRQMGASGKTGEEILDCSW